MANPVHSESSLVSHGTRRAKTVPNSEANTATGEGLASVCGPPKWTSPEFGEIYEAHSRQIYYLALRFLGDPAQAEDATHDVFLKAYRKLSEFRGDSAMRTWLYRIAINHCKNLLQTWHQRNMVSNADDAIWEGAVAGTENPLRALEVKELGQRIQKSLAALPEEYRLLLLLVADERLSYEEMAALTEQSADAVRGKLHRARKAFTAHFHKSA
jgi:RNA polymerase sigma-70 factor (ECF subfamily)